MSLTMALTRGLLRFTPTNTATPQTLRAALADRKPPAPVTRAIRRVARVERSVVNGCPVIRLTPKAHASGNHLIYTPGGAYVSPILATHWNILAGLIERSGVSVTVALYGLAPEHHVDEAYDLLDTLYEAAQAEFGGRVFVGGDSAGGALALGQAMRYRDAAKPPPLGVVLISPWVDATMSNPEIGALARLDPMLGAAGLAEAGRWWAGTSDVRDPLVSPLFGRLDALPPVYIYQGDRDLLVADAKLLTRRIAQTGGRAELRIYPGAIHVFVGAPWTPEARRALRHLGAVLRGQA
ncbi:alpha/beta hydrolase fold domain-containing protein [Subtercola sp. YIM 133946]|uniref:alpha/beta hydrolase fold domain-containing protein n=1 Tax=Subtercola sp. YIM 133946 TaxID=3118909 RepID=UPI002F9260B8